MELCRAVQPDGGGQRCIRFDGHEGPHQTFVAEWSNGESVSRRRQPAHAKSQAAYPNRPQEAKSRRQQSRPGKSQQQPQGQGRGRRSRNRKKH